MFNSILDFCFGIKVGFETPEDSLVLFLVRILPYLEEL